MAKNRLMLVVAFILLLLSLLFLLIARIYWQHSFSLGAYLPQYLTCTIDKPSQIEEKILYKTQTQNFSFALTKTGVYRKALVDEKWSLLNCPSPIDLEFYFRVTPYSDKVVSFPGLGLYISNDAGLTWTTIYDNISFVAAFISKENILYVDAIPPTNYFDFEELYGYIRSKYYGYSYYDRDRILMSRDFGKTWKDITGNIPSGARIDRIDEDPYNSSTVCLDGWNIRQYAFQVASSNFGNYKWTKIASGNCRKPNTLVIP